MRLVAEMRWRLYELEIAGCPDSLADYVKQARKGFRTKARDWDFIDFRIQMTGEFFKSFDQNSWRNSCKILQGFDNFKN
jgi:hypothetical protein